MDEMKIKLSTMFMKGIITKIIKKAILNKFGYNVDIQINEIEAKTIDGKIHFHVDVDAEINNSEFIKILKTIGLNWP